MRHLTILFFVLLSFFASRAAAQPCGPVTLTLTSSSTMSSIACTDPGFRRGPNGGHFLSGFDLSFTNGDHKPQAFGVLHRSNRVLSAFRSAGLRAVTDDTPNQDMAAVVLADPDREDPLTARLLYEPHNRRIPIYQLSVENCQGPCRIAVPDDRSFRDRVFLLRGFLFLRDARFDDNLRTVAVLPQCPADRSTACFIDVNFQDSNRDETYDAIVQYSILPESAVTRRSNHVVERTDTDDETRNSRSVTTAFRQDRPSGLAIGLERFELRFTSSDHFVGRIAIMPDQERGAAIVLRDGGDNNALRKVGYTVTFLGIDRNWLE